jgi:glycosyltransferase involved in cell wall biosynthesis
MRVAIVAPPWVPVPPPAYGGTEAVLDGLARALVDAGHDVLLHATGDSSCPVERTATFDCALGVGIGGAAAEARHVIDAYEAATSWGADVVHDHTIVGPIYSHRFDGLPVVTTNHGPFDSDLGPLYRAVGGRVPVIAISADHASAAVDTNVAAVIHHGVDVEAFPFGGGDGGYALFLGRMSPDKGVAEAARIAHAAGIPLRIAAKMHEPAERAYFDEVVRPLIGGGVDYVGEAGGAYKLRLLADAVCLLNPIRWREPFGMVMIEALACGTPVVATPCGAAPEIVDDGVTGYLRTDCRDLAAGVVAAGALDRDACRQAAKERFSAARMAEDHLALFARLARN